MKILKREKQTLRQSVNIFSNENNWNGNASTFATEAVKTILYTRQAVNGTMPNHATSTSV